MMAAANGGSEARATIEVTLSQGVFTTENSKRFALQAGGSLRIGRDAGSHMPVDLNGVSGTHAELLFQRAGNSETDPLELCICDHSRNGTAVRPGPHVPGSSWASKVAPAWQRLVHGVPRPLAHGWQVLTPARSRKGDHQVPFHKRMLTVYTKGAAAAAADTSLEGPSAVEVMSAKVAAAAAAAAGMEMTPEDAAKVRKEKKRKRDKDDPNRAERKRQKAKADDDEAAVSAAVTAAAEHDRRVAQCGAVEEELARREITRHERSQAAAAEEITRTARPKRKGQPQGAVDNLAELSDGEQPMTLRSPSPAHVEAVQEDAEAEAAQRAVAAAAALRAMKASKKVDTPPKKLGLKPAKEVRRQAPEEIESDVEDASQKKPATLTAANVATLGGASRLVDFELGSVSDISVAGVKPKQKKKRMLPDGSVDPGRRRKSDGKREGKAILSKRGKDSPERWNPSPPAKLKKRSARSPEGDDRVRNRSREKRKQREAELGRKGRR